MVIGSKGMAPNLLPWLPYPFKMILFYILSKGWNSSIMLITLSNGDNSFWIIAALTSWYFYFSASIFSSPASSSIITKSTSNLMLISNPLMNCLFDLFYILEINLFTDRSASFTVSSMLATCLYWLWTYSKN